MLVVPPMNWRANQEATARGADGEVDRPARRRAASASGTGSLTSREPAREGARQPYVGRGHEAGRT